MCKVPPALATALLLGICRGTAVCKVLCCAARRNSSSHLWASRAHQEHRQVPNVRSPKGKRKITLTTVTNAYLCHLLQTIQAIQLRIADGRRRLSSQQKKCVLLKTMVLVISFTVPYIQRSTVCSTAAFPGHIGWYGCRVGFAYGFHHAVWLIHQYSDAVKLCKWSNWPFHFFLSTLVSSLQE